MSIKAIFKGVLTALVISLVIIVIMAALMYFTSINENMASIGVYAGTAVGVIIGAIVSAKTAGGKTLFNCLAMGLLYLAVLALVTLAFNGNIAFNYHLLAVVGAVVLCSVFGAIVGR